MQTKNNQPYTFYYRHHRYYVKEVREYWRESGQWWLGEKELHIYQVIADNGLFELHYLQNCWVLYKIYD